MSGPTSTVFVVDDERSVRTAIARLLQSVGLSVATFASAGAFLEAHDNDVPGCLILDLAMPEGGGLEVQRMLQAGGESRPIIFLSGHADVPETVLAMKGGAFEFLTKPVEDEILLGAVFSAIEKDASERSARAALAEIRHRIDLLTPRELQVLQGVVAGKLNKQSASELGIVEKTIKAHRARVMEKLQAHSLAELVLLAARAGILSSSEGYGGGAALVRTAALGPKANYDGDTKLLSFGDERHPAPDRDRGR